MPQAIMDENGKTLATRQPTLAECLVFSEGDGSDITVHDTSIVNLCCWGHIQLLTKFAMYNQHEKINVATKLLSL